MLPSSLLPPAVNAGILWVAYGFFENNRTEEDYDNGDYDVEYVLTITRHDFRKGGVISLLLTLANILLVIIASMFMFRLKEKLPIKKKVFWEVGSCFWEEKRTIGPHFFLTRVIPSFLCSCRFVLVGFESCPLDLPGPGHFSRRTQGGGAGGEPARTTESRRPLPETYVLPGPMVDSDSEEEGVEAA